MNLFEYTEYQRQWESQETDKTGMRLEYEIQEKDNALQLQKQKQQRNMAWSGVGVILLITTGVGIYARGRTKHQIEMEKVKTQAIIETDQLKSRFFANISHEFRTPLTLINGHLESLKESAENEELLIYSEMEQYANQLLSLINQLLETSKMDHGQYQLSFKEGNILMDIAAHVQSFHYQGVRQGIDIQLHTTELAKEYLADRQFVYAPEVLAPIINNLLSNALKFTPKGGYIHITVDFEEKGVCIAVADSGPGINQDQLPHVFERYFQVKDSSRTEHTGFGIGLALIKELAIKHGGDVTVESPKGGGCVFRVWLKESDVIVPIQDVQPNILENKPIEKPEKPSKTPNSDLPILLIVEDQVDLRRFMVNGLAQDYRIIEAIDGNDGLKKASESIPDVIISDVMMPGMDGMTLCETLKNQDATSHIPTILLTALADGDDRLKGLAAGADDYLAKPFSMAELRLRLKNIIDSRNTLREKFASGKLALSTPNGGLSLRDREFLNKLTQTVHEQMSNAQLSVDTLAQSIHLSSSQLTRKLKAITSQTPAEFIKIIKLQQGMDLLRKGEGVSEVAWALGYEDPSYFAKVFKKNFGKTPSSVFGEDTNR